MGSATMAFWGITDAINLLQTLKVMNIIKKKSELTNKHTKYD